MSALNNQRITMKNKKELWKRIMKNPAAYVARFTKIETAREFHSHLKAHFIMKVGTQFWVARGRYASLLNDAGYEYTR
jgi:hypothetical protein|nr:MAG TPA: hypothetical protein [Caudoviricetes sp.]